MANEDKERIGFACAYTPLAIIHAAGYAPYRILPMGDSPDRAGQLLHDNLCPHVKRILDRALHADLPPFAGMVFMNSCDAMRRLADAWSIARPNDRIILLDLPTGADEMSVSFFAGELSRLSDRLRQWGGRPVTPQGIEASLERYNELSRLFNILRERNGRGALPGGIAKLQELCNQASTEPIEQSLALLKRLVSEPEPPSAASNGIPVFLFGNIMPDPSAFGLFERCGVRIAGDDLCTGSRLFSPTETGGPKEVMPRLARSLLSRPRCARTLDPFRPGNIAEEVLAKAKACGARGVIAHTVKFCDPYLARIPLVRKALQEAGLPLLFLEGDCTMRSIEQQRTRIEAFVEMLGQ